MIIDKEKLISLLVEKTGSKQEEVEEQLTELINRIQEAASEGKTFEIEGFGTFSMEDDTLQFEPSSLLQTEVNNKYAGMKPIELIGAFKQPEGEEIPDMIEPEKDEEEIWTFDEESVEEETSTKADKPVNKAEEKDEVEESGEPAIPKATEEQPKERTTSDDETSAEDIGDGDLGMLGQEFSGDQSEEDETEEKEEQKKDKKTQKVAAESDTKSDPIERFLMVAVVLIAIGVAGWFIYDFGFNSLQNTNSANQNFTRQSAQKNVQPQQTGDLDKKSQDQSDPSQETGSGKKSEPQQQLKVTKQEGSHSEAAKPNNPYGLKGTVNHSISGYTIVVHSLKDQQKAEKNRQYLQEKGFRAIIQSAVVNSVLYYRVGIGQFPTVDAAEKTIKKLPEPYKSNNFIKRIKQQ